MQQSTATPPPVATNRRHAIGQTLALGTLSTLAALGLSGCAHATGQAPKQTPGPGDSRKTYVLIHGAFHGGWCWHGTRLALEAMGHRVLTPTLTGAGERSYLISKDITLQLWVQDVVNAIHWAQAQNLVLVGHSFAGLTVAALAEALPQRPQQLIFLDALLLESGQSAFDVRPHTEVAKAEKAAQDYGQGLGVPPPPLNVFGLRDPALVAHATPYLTAHPLSVYRSKLQLQKPLGNGIHSTYVRCTEPLFEALAPSRDIARRAGFSFQDIAASHEVMLSHPRELAGLLDAITASAQ